MKRVGEQLELISTGEYSLGRPTEPAIRASCNQKVKYSALQEAGRKHRADEMSPRTSGETDVTTTGLGPESTREAEITGNSAGRGHSAHRR